MHEAMIVTVLRVVEGVSNAVRYRDVDGRGWKACPM